MFNFSNDCAYNISQRTVTYFFINFDEKVF